jgi:DNA-binding XRE family transcriptional regulator
MYKVAFMSDIDELVDAVGGRESIAMQNAAAWAAVHSELVKFRIQSGLTQKQVANRLGVTQPAVSYFESDSGDTKISSLLMYCNAVGATIRFDLN